MTGSKVRGPDRPGRCAFALIFVLILAPALCLSTSCKDKAAERPANIDSPGHAIVWPGDTIACIAGPAPGKAGKVNIKGVVKNAVGIRKGDPIELLAGPGDWLYLAVGAVPGLAARPVKFTVRAGTEVIAEVTASPEGVEGWTEVSVKLPGELKGQPIIECDLAGHGAFIAHPRLIQEEDPDRPPVYFVLIDALRADALGAYGAKDGATRNLDRLAAEGVVFKRAYTSSPFTMTSLASIFTGRHPWQHKVTFSEGGGLTLSSEITNLVTEFNRAGYHTAAFSGTHFQLSKNGFARGFDHMDETCAPSFFRDSADCLNRRIVSWLRSGARRGPVMVYIHYVDPHEPYYARQGFRDRYIKDLAKPGHDDVALGEIEQYGESRGIKNLLRKPADEEVTYLRGLYQGEAAYVDHAVGELVEAIEGGHAGGRAPIILFTADHGEAFNEHGVMGHVTELHDPVMRIPLIVLGAGVRGKAIEDQARTIDMFPTLLDLAGITLPADIAGRSLAPLMRGQDLPTAPAVATHFGKGKPEYALVVGPWKLISGPDHESASLFNLDRDPAENNDLSITRPEQLKIMRKILDGLLALDSPAAKAPPMDEETIRRLEALGY